VNNCVGLVACFVLGEREIVQHRRQIRFQARSFFESGHRFRKPIQIRQRNAKIVFRLGVIMLVRNRPLISVGGVAEFPGHQIRIAQIVFRVSEARLECGCLLKRLNRLSIFFQSVLRCAQVVQCLWIVRLQTKRLRECIDRVFVFARLVRRRPKIIETESVRRS